MTVLVRTLLLLVLAFTPIVAQSDDEAGASPRASLAAALTGQADPLSTVQALPLSDDPQVLRVLAAWRIGGVYLYPAPDGTKIPFLLQETGDEAGLTAAFRADNGEPLLDGNGKPLRFRSGDHPAVDTTSKLRKAIKKHLDLASLAAADPKARRDAANKLGFEQNKEYLPVFQKQLDVETDPRVKKSLVEAIAVTRLASVDPAERTTAATDLGKLPSIASLDLLKKVSQKKDEPAAAAAKESVRLIEEHMLVGQTIGTAFRGLSLASVLLIAALGLAITFGLMGVINMAHGEMIMVGAYTAYVTQNIFVARFGAASTGFELYLPVALVAAFFSAGAVGLLLERSVIRFLYRRPLESLLATWGVSLCLQQIFRSTFGAANVQVTSPSWVSGSFEWHDVLFAYNRIFVIGIAILSVAGTWFLLAKTKAGLQMRAVMQHRAMASCLGVSTGNVNMMTFAFGSGLAGVAGACLSQIGNVGPSLGQAHIVDCFMIVVLGGVGNLVGTISAALGVGVVDQMLQPVLGAVLGKITVLVGIILFLQWRPAGLFVARTRSLEG